MSLGIARGGSASHRSRSSPIPDDPCYRSTMQANVKENNFRLKGPISADPGISSERSTNTAVSRRPHLSSEALVIARHHQGQELAKLFNPAMKIIPIGVRHTKHDSKNHGKENHRKIIEMQRANKEKQVESSRHRPVKAVYKPDKFEHVQSKVANYVKTPLAPRPSTTDGYRQQRSLSSADLNIQGHSFSSTKPNTKEIDGGKRKRPQSAQVKRSVPPAEEKKGKTRPASARNRPFSTKTADKQQRPKSHIQLNKEAVRKSNLKRSPSLSALDDLKKKKDKELDEHRRGGVPKYLRNRQEQWKRDEEERIANIPDPSIPEGHTLMAEQDRRITLEKLKKSHSELLCELKSMPLSRDTLRVKTRKAELEEKLRDTDAAIKIFSRERVFIKMDE